MNETGELIEPTAGPVSPEFSDAMKTAIAEIQAEAHNPVQQVAKSTAELGFFEELGQVGKSYGKRELGIMWKNIKALGLGGLSLFPLIGTVGNVGKAVEAGGKFAQARKLATGAKYVGDLGDSALAAKSAFKASLKQIPLSRNVITGPWQAGRKAWEARKVVKAAEKASKVVQGIGTGLDFTPLVRANEVVNTAKEAATAANKGLKEAVRHTAFHKAMEFVDPTPDVPGKISLIFGLGQIILPGSNLVPAAWQIAVNNYESTVNKAGFIKDVARVYKRQAEKFFARLKEPKARQAARAFVPATA